MRKFLDHNVMAPAIAALGGLDEVSEITNDMLDDSYRRAKGLRPVTRELRALRNLVLEVQAGQTVLVASDYCLETLRRALVRGGSDFEAMDDLTARKAVAVIRQLAVRNGGLANSAEVKKMIPAVQEALRGFIGSVRGQIDHEDVVVVATAMAGNDDATDVVTNDVGLRAAVFGLRIADVQAFSLMQYEEELKNRRKSA